jgi:hypothetical protein
MTARGRETQTHHSSEEEQNRPSFRHVFLDARFPFFVPRIKLHILRGREAAQRAGEAIKKAVNSGSLAAIQEKGPLGGVQEALAE